MVVDSGIAAHPAAARETVSIVNVGLPSIRAASPELPQTANVHIDGAFRSKPKAPRADRGKRTTLGNKCHVWDCLSALRRAPIVDHIRNVDTLARGGEDVARRLVREGAVADILHVMQTQPTSMSVVGNCICALAALCSTYDGDHALYTGGGVRIVLAAAESLFALVDGRPREGDSSPPGLGHRGRGGSKSRHARDVMPGPPHGRMDAPSAPPNRTTHVPYSTAPPSPAVPANSLGGQASEHLSGDPMRSEGSRPHASHVRQPLRVHAMDGHSAPARDAAAHSQADLAIQLRSHLGHTGHGAVGGDNARPTLGHGFRLDPIPPTPIQEANANNASSNPFLRELTGRSPAGGLVSSGGGSGSGSGSGSTASLDREGGGGTPTAAAATSTAAVVVAAPPQQQEAFARPAAGGRRTSIATRRQARPLTMADQALTHDSANGRRASVSLSALPGRTNLGMSAASSSESDSVGLFGVKLGTFERRVVPRRSFGSNSSLKGLSHTNNSVFASTAGLCVSEYTSVVEGSRSTTPSQLREEPEDGEIIDVTERLLELFREQIKGHQRMGQSDTLVEAIAAMDAEELRRSLVYASTMFGRLGRLVALLESIGAEVSGDSLMLPLTDAVRELLGVKYAALYVLDGERGELWTTCQPFDTNCEAGAPLAPSYSMAGSMSQLYNMRRWVSISADITGVVARSGEAMYIDNPASDPRFAQSEFGNNATLCVPVKAPPSENSAGGRLLGVLVASGPCNALPQEPADSSIASRFGIGPRARFDPEDELLLRSLARESAAVLQKALDLTVLMKAQQRVSVLLDTTRILSSEVELDGLIRVISQSAKTLLNADRCTIFLVDNDTSELWTNVYDFDGRVREIRIKKSMGIAGAVATTGRIVNIQDAYLDDRFNQDIDRKTGYRTRSMIAMPIVNIVGETIGVIQMINKLNGGPFNFEDERLLNAFSSQAAVAIEKSKLFQKSTHMRQYLENILGSINSTVLTLSPAGNLVTTNRADLLTDLGISKAKMTGASYYSWLGDANRELATAIERVYKTGVAVQGSDYLLVGPHGTVSVNYSLAPLEGRQQRDGNVYWSRIRNSLRRLQGINRHARIAKAHRLREVDAGNALDPDDGAEMSNFEQNFWATYRAQLQYQRAEQEFDGIVVVLDDISKEKKMMTTLGRYMSPSLAQQVLEEGGQKLGGTRQKVTVMFGDIRGFTNMSESMDPRDLVETLNGYFECAVDAISQNNGILDKYIGDAVMAVFGVPFVADDDAIRACRTALQMQRNLGRLNVRRAQKGEPALGFGIGVNTGVVVNGNVGCLKRMEYTVIGDSVNLASRVEGLTKKYHVCILISEFTLAETGDTFLVREVDRVRVVGKKKPIGIYELVCERSELSTVGAAAAAEIAAMSSGNVDASGASLGVSGESASTSTDLVVPSSERRLSEIVPGGFADTNRKIQLLPLYVKGLDAMRGRRFADAMALFEEGVQGGDGAAEVMLERCRRLSETTLDDDWDGVWNADAK